MLARGQEGHVDPGPPERASRPPRATAASRRAVRGRMVGCDRPRPSGRLERRGGQTTHADSHRAEARRRRLSPWGGGRVARDALRRGDRRRVVVLLAATPGSPEHPTRGAARPHLPAAEDDARPPGRPRSATDPTPPRRARTHDHGPDPACRRRRAGRHRLPRPQVPRHDPRRTRTACTAGSHRINVSAEGYDMYGETIELAAAPRDVMVRFKEVRLDERLDVVHKHGVGSCRGRLLATTAGLRYEADKAGDSFEAAFASLEPLQLDYLGGNLRVKQRGGRTYELHRPERGRAPHVPEGRRGREEEAVTERPIPPGLPARARRPDARLVHAPGRPLHGRVPRAAREALAARALPHAGAGASRSRCSRSARSTSTPRSCSPTCCCRSSRWASRSTSQAGEGPVIENPLRTRGGHRRAAPVRAARGRCATVLEAIRLMRARARRACRSSASRARRSRSPRTRSRAATRRTSPAPRR